MKSFIDSIGEKTVNGFHIGQMDRLIQRDVNDKKSWILVNSLVFMVTFMNLGIVNNITSNR